MASAHPLTRRRPTGQVWVALWLLVFAALAPSLSHVLQASHSGPVQTICSSTGSIPVPDGGEPPDEESAMPGAHCLFCLQPTDRGTPPPQPLPYHLMVQGGSQVPVVWQAFFYVLNSVWGPPPRGPPTA